MANENVDNFYQMDFYLGGDCSTEFSELNNVTLRSEKIENFAERLKLIRNFRKNVFNVTIHKCENGKYKGLLYSVSIKELEKWFKEKGLTL